MGMVLAIDVSLGSSPNTAKIESGMPLLSWDGSSGRLLQTVGRLIGSSGITVTVNVMGRMASVPGLRSWRYTSSDCMGLILLLRVSNFQVCALVCGSL